MPAPGLRRGKSGVDDLGDGKPVAEGGPDRLAGVDGLQEIACLDDDLVLIAGAMAGALAERAVIGMCGAGQDAGKAARGLAPLGPVEMDRVLIFLIKADRAFGAVDFIGVAHLAPCRHAADEQMPHHARGKAQHQLRLVVIGHRLGALRAGAAGVHGLDPG